MRQVRTINHRGLPGNRRDERLCVRIRIQRGEIASDTDRRLLHGLRITSQDHQAGDRRLSGGDTWGDLATHAVAKDEDAGGIHSRLALEQMDGGDRVRRILVSHREVGRVRHLAVVGVRHLVEAHDRHTTARQSPREVLERLVRSAGLIAVERSLRR